MDARVIRWVTEFVLRDRPNPAAKATSFIGVIPLNTGRDCLQDLLDDVGRICILQTNPPRPMVNQRRADSDESVPCLALLPLMRWISVGDV